MTSHDQATGVLRNRLHRSRQGIEKFEMKSPARISHSRPMNCSWSNYCAGLAKSARNYAKRWSQNGRLERGVVRWK